MKSRVYLFIAIAMFIIGFFLVGNEGPEFGWNLLGMVLLVGSLIFAKEVE